MLRVTVELVPWGVESEKKTLGTMIIANDGTGTHQRGNYNVRRYGRRGITKKPLREARVENWPRLSRSVWELVRTCLDNTFST